MEPTSSKKIISLQIENANYSRDNGVLRDKLAILQVENNNLKLEVNKLKEQLLSLTSVKVEEVLTSEDVQLEEQTQDDNKSFKKRERKNGL
jgi:hypothetical protein